MTPYPSTAVPGSIPRPFTDGASGFRLCQLSRVDIEVGENLGDVVQIFQGIQETDDPLGVGSFDPHRAAGDHCQLGGIDCKTSGPERVLHQVEGGRNGGNDVLVTLASEILGPAVQRCLESRIFAVAGRIESNLPLPVEHPGYRVAGSQIPAIPAEGVANL